MDLSMMVFVLGTLLSYYPLYCLMKRTHTSWEKQKSKPRKVSNANSPQLHFLDSLRYEAVARARSTVTDLASKVRASIATGNHSRLGPDDSRRLDETDGMLRQLLPVEAALAYSRIATVLRTATPMSNEQFDELIRNFESELDAVIAPPDPALNVSARASSRTPRFAASSMIPRSTVAA